MSGIIDAFGFKSRHTLYSGTITGDPTLKDSNANKRYIQKRLLDCFLLRKHKEALLLLDALLVDRDEKINIYWKALAGLVLDLFPDRAEQVLGGSFNSLHPMMANDVKDQAQNAMLRYLASKGNHKDVLEWLQMHNNLKNTTAQKVAALSSLKQIDPDWNTIESTKKVHPAAVAKLLGTDDPDSEQDSSDSEVDGDEDNGKNEDRPHETMMAEKKRKHSADHGQTARDNTRDGKKKRKKRRQYSSDVEEDTDEDYVEDPDRISKETGWSMPPRTFHFNMKGANDALSAVIHGRFKSEDAAEQAIVDFYDALQTAMDQSVDNLPLIRILLPYFSHYSEEWFELMKRHCRVDPAGDVNMIKRLEHRCRKLLKSANHEPDQEKYTNTMVELLLERIGYACYDQWTLNKTIQWLDLCGPNVRRRVCRREAWIYRFLQAECQRAPPDTVSLIEKLQKYFKKP
ncbi:hypothetical protein INT43_003041 [Umbelopsis isabellina]|uniref:Uncharacterized protein n=1 Tax=Mortierella isabellina TaxID=91625 RepID=A0A8H7PP33_MORIS|nr:hypothetical protein INT43_003041 [Umbelopsis isabellina]